MAIFGSHSAARRVLRDLSLVLVLYLLATLAITQRLRAFLYNSKFRTLIVAESRIEIQLLHSSRDF